MSLVVAISPSSFATQDRSPLDLLESIGAKIIPNPYNRRLTEKEIMSHLKGVDGLIAGLEPLNRTVLTSASMLKAIARVGIGMENVDLDAAQELGIKVSNTPDGPTQAVAEMTIAAMLTLCRNIIPFNAALHEKKWVKSISRGLINTRVLLVGYGRIGRAVGTLLRSFGASILVTDPVLSVKDLEEGEQLVSLDEGLELAEVISLHASGNDTMLGSKEFKKMQDGVILLNSARGELIDEPVLIKSLESGKVNGAWFDVFAEEPYKGKLAKFDQVLLTPHISTYTQHCRKSMELSAVKNLLRDLGVDSNNETLRKLTKWD